MTDTLPRTTAEEGGEPRPRQPFLGLSPLQVLGGALAAISAAVVSSYLGVAGTLIGAALASIVSTVGGALYTESMRSAHGRLRQGIQTVGSRRSDGRRSGSVRAEHPDHRGPASTAADSGGAEEDYVLVVRTRRPGLLDALRRVSARAWLGTAAVFLIAVLAITAFEMFTGKPVSASVGGGTSKGTTIGSVVDSGSNARTTPSTSPSPEETQATDGATPTGQVQEPGDSTPTEAETQDSRQQDPVPQQSATADRGQQTGDSADVTQQESAPAAEPTAGDQNPAPGGDSTP